MRIHRRFTEPNKDVYASIEWSTRSSRISNSDGSTVFEMTDAEIPTTWSQLATDIVVSKYFRKAGVPQIGTDGQPKVDASGKPVLGPERSVKHYSGDFLRPPPGSALLSATSDVGGPAAIEAATNAHAALASIGAPARDAASPQSEPLHESVRGWSARAREHAPRRRATAGGAADTCCRAAAILRLLRRRSLGCCARVRVIRHAAAREEKRKNP